MGNVEHTVVKTARGEFVLRVFSGTVNTEDIMDSFVYIINQGMISPDCMGILTDLRSTDFAISIATTIYSIVTSIY